MLTKEAQNRLENAKTDLKPFLTILGTSQRATFRGCQDICDDVTPVAKDLVPSYAVIRESRLCDNRQNELQLCRSHIQKIQIGKCDD
jgi:hypothetical protein